MEAEEQKNEPEEEPKVPKRVKLSINKIKEISSRMLEPVVEEQKAMDMRKLIRAIKDPDLVIKGTKKKMSTTLEEEKGSQTRMAERKKESVHSLYKVPGTDIQLPNMNADAIGFLECMSGPRFPNFDETESDTTFERLSNDDESEETRSMLELMNSDTAEDSADQEPVKERKGCKKPAELLEEEEEEVKPRKPEMKGKRKIRRKGVIPDPLILEYTEGVSNYLKEIGIFGFMKEWLTHLYGTNPKPKDPVKLLRKYLEDSLGNSEKESGVSQLEKELRMTQKQEDDIIVEISKLNHLAHLLAPEIYDADGNMIYVEPSIQEEQFVIEEESVLTPSVENVENRPTNAKARRATTRSRITVKKAKGKQSTPELSKVPSKISKGKFKKKKSVARLKTK